MGKVKIRRVGNSLGIILPKDLLDLIGLSDGDEIQLDLEQKSIDIKLKKVKKK